MRGMNFSVLWIALAIAIFGYAPAAEAQATRTWVSGVGDDANPCSRTAPCKTFAGAISKTAASGEINCIDPGGFGAVTITKAIAIICDNVLAGVLVSGTNGVTVNAGATDNVLLSGLDFEGLLNSPNGVNIVSAGSVTIRNSTIRGFVSGTAGNGVYVGPSSGSLALLMDNVVLDQNSGSASGDAIFVQPAGGASVKAVFNNVRVINSGSGFRFDGTNGPIFGEVRNSVSTNVMRGGVSAIGSNIVNVLLDGSASVANGTGIISNGTGVIIRLTRTAVTGNGTGLTTTSGAIQSYGDNEIDNNTAVGSTPTAVSHN